MQILRSHCKSPDSGWMLISPLWVDQIRKYSSQPPFFSFPSPGEFVFVYMKSKAFFLEMFILGHERETSRQSRILRFTPLTNCRFIFKPFPIGPAPPACCLPLLTYIYILIHGRYTDKFLALLPCSCCVTPILQNAFSFPNQKTLLPISCDA